ncbi:MAG: DUF4840 domain-containing protein [Muribaculaceae bacterium]
METKRKLNITSLLLMFLVVTLATSCNKDDGEKVSAEQIRQALFDMKGSSHGTIKASFYQGAEIVEIDNVKAISRDSLIFVMPLEPIARTISDEKVATILRTIEKVEVKAGYHFYQIDDNGYSVFFTLTPKRIIIPASDDVPDIIIAFADSYGGSFQKNFNYIIFNISPKEILVGGVKPASFKQLVYHFDGKYE